MNKIKAILRLMFAHRFCVFTDIDADTWQVRIQHLRVGDAEKLANWLNDRANTTRAEARAVIEANKIIGNNLNL